MIKGNLMLRILAVLLLIFFHSPALAEPVVGESCSTYAPGSVMQTAGAEAGGVARLLACKSGVWAVAEINPDPCAGTPALGAKCKDGTFYAGLSPDGNVPMFAMPTDGPISTWNNDTNEWVVTGMGLCTASEASCTTGRANTTLLANSVDEGSPYGPAKYCEDLTAYGYSDWYLPSRNELKVVNTGLVAVTAANFVNTYWSSSENHSARAWYVAPNGTQDLKMKNWFYSVRCVRR